MIKILFTLFLSLVFCNTGFAESYYFKECKLSEELLGNYLIDFDKNVIRATIVRTDGKVQELTDKIKSITKDRIVSEIIQNKKNKKYYLQYSLDANSKLVTRQRYIKKHKDDFILPDGPKSQGHCVNVKADWDKHKIEEAEASREQEQILKTQKQLLKEQNPELKCQGNDLKQWANCQGTYATEDGYKYIGQFKDGKILKGTATYPNGAKYIGQFKNDKPHGQGTFIYPDGSKYYGEWKDGKGHGHGIKTWQDEKKYIGQFKNDKPHGQGTFTYPDGSKYYGEYKDGKRHGQGTLTYSDGRSYMGQFAAGLEHGAGLCINQDGSSVECKVLKMENRGASTEKNKHNISAEIKKWVKLSEYEYNLGKGKKIMEKLENNFDKRASELCSSTGSFDILEKRIEVLVMDETPAFGLETVVKLGIDGVVECK